jgi:hypothetical protein
MTTAQERRVIHIEDPWVNIKMNYEKTKTFCGRELKSRYVTIYKDRTTCSHCRKRVALHESNLSILNKSNPTYEVFS